MMDNDHGAAERGADRIGGADEFRHVVRLVLVADERAVECVDHHGDGGVATCAWMAAISALWSAMMSTGISSR